MRRVVGLELAPTPATRADCRHAARPCMRLACRHHLALNVSEVGTISIIGGDALANSPTDQDLEAFADAVLDRVGAVGSCALDVVDRNPDGLTLQEIAALLDVTRERIRQLEKKAFAMLRPRVRRRLLIKSAADVAPALAPISTPDEGA